MNGTSVHQVLVPGSGDVARQGRFVLAQALAVQPVAAHEDAGVDRQVVPADRVVDLDALRLVLRVNRRGPAQALRLIARRVEDRRAVEVQAAAGNADEAPAVRAADQVLRVGVLLIPRVQFVRDRRAEHDVVGDLAGVAEEVVLVQLRGDAVDAAAGGNAVEDVAVAVDHRLDEGVVRRLAGDRRGHGQVAHAIEVGDVEPRPDGVTEGRVGDDVRRSRRLVGEMRVLECQQAARVDDPRALGDANLLLRLVAGTGRRRLVGGETIAAILAIRAAVAEVEQHRAGRRDRHLAEALVAGEVVLRQRAVEIRAVLTRVLRPVVRRVEMDAVRDHRTADIAREPAAVGVVARLRAARQVGGHSRRLELVADLAGEAVRPGLADRIDREPARAVEVDGAGAALGRRHLRDVVRRGLGRQRAEQRQRHVDAVELVDVVLAAAAGARAAGLVVGVLDAGDQLHQVAILLAHRHRHDLLVRDAALDACRVTLDERRRRRHLDALGQGLEAEGGVDDRVLAQLNLCLPRHRLHAGEHVGNRVVAGRQRQETIFTADVGRRHARRRQHAGARFDGHAGQHPAARVNDLAADNARLLGEGGMTGKQQRRDEQQRPHHRRTAGTHQQHWGPSSS